MVAFNPNSHKLIVSAGDLDEAAPLDAKVMLGSLLNVMGLASVTIGTVAPVDKKTLWWNKDVNQFRRYNPVTSQWLQLSPDLFALHLLHRAFTAANVEGSFANDDLFSFFDVSAGETKMISSEDLKALLPIHGWSQFSTFTVSAPIAQYDAALPSVFSEIMVSCQNINGNDYSGAGAGTGWELWGQFLTAANAVIPITNGDGQNRFRLNNLPQGERNGARSGQVMVIGDKASQLGNFRYAADESNTGHRPWARHGGDGPVTTDVAKIRIVPVYGAGHTGSSNLTAGTIKVWVR
ncbi:MAG: hypothetical protein M9939_26550 [Mesorhizobium sp.]|nr:hypothetical protein [Mesorhizobium sp.]MCO5164654.1 hypothetical protein [Mesorhizobium sp.]